MFVLTQKALLAVGGFLLVNQTPKPLEESYSTLFCHKYTTYLENRYNWASYKQETQPKQLQVIQ